MALAAECYIPQLHAGDETALYGAATYVHPSHPALRRPQQRIQQPAPAPQTWVPTPEKDYSVPLHVDCSVEYELPDCAKPPQGVKIEPLLMIHPAHFRRLDSLRRCPFVNNLPAACGGSQSMAMLPFELAAPPPRAACCRAADPRWAPPGPREGDTLDTLTGFGKWPPKARSARHKQQAAHPYATAAAEPHPIMSAAGTIAQTQNCDKTFEMLQGNCLVSPFHAKMFSSESVYQNYPIVMYK